MDAYEREQLQKIYASQQQRKAAMQPIGVSSTLCDGPMNPIAEPVPLIADIINLLEERVMISGRLANSIEEKLHGLHNTRDRSTEPSPAADCGGPTDLVLIINVLSSRLYSTNRSLEESLDKLNALI